MSLRRYGAHSEHVGTYPSGLLIDSVLFEAAFVRGQCCTAEGSHRIAVAVPRAHCVVIESHAAVGVTL